MPAPEGNQFAKGHGFGRPCGYDIEKEAEELIKWSHQDDALILRYFAALRGYSDQTMYRWRDENEVFRGAFEYAKNLIGCRREEMYLEAKSESPFKRYATYYDADLQKHEIEESKKKSESESAELKLTAEQIKQIKKTING